MNKLPDFLAALVPALLCLGTVVALAGVCEHPRHAPTPVTTMDRPAVVSTAVATAAADTITAARG